MARLSAQRAAPTPPLRTPCLGGHAALWLQQLGVETTLFAARAPGDMCGAAAQHGGPLAAQPGREAALGIDQWDDGPPPHARSIWPPGPPVSRCRGWARITVADD